MLGKDVSLQQRLQHPLILILKDIFLYVQGSGKLFDSRGAKGGKGT